MKYLNNGIEITYRESQILRDAAMCCYKNDNDFDISHLFSRKDDLIKNIEEIAEKQSLKETLCKGINEFLLLMEKSYYEAFTEYLETLVKRHEGIPVLTLFYLSNRKVVMPVNKHQATADF